MKNFINNHVHGSQLATVGNNNYKVERMLMSGYGIFPKFEISPSYSVVVEYEPRGGLLGLIFSSISYFCPFSKIEVYSSDYNCTQWKGLFPWRYTLGYTIYGCRIRHERHDSFSVSHCTNVGGIVSCYNYDVCISAIIEPKTFYIRVKERPAELCHDILNCVKDIIANKLEENYGNPAFVLHTPISSTALEQAGYCDVKCRIQYNPKSK